MGLDGQSKMSKSLNNCIFVLDSEQEMWEKLKFAYTDPARLRRTDPGNPDICNIYMIHKGFSSTEDLEMINTECRKAGIGCVDCKKLLLKNMITELKPVQDNIQYYRNNVKLVKEILDSGAKKCYGIAREVMDEVLNVTGLRA